MSHENVIDLPVKPAPDNPPAASVAESRLVKRLADLLECDAAPHEVLRAVGRLKSELKRQRFEHAEQLRQVAAALEGRDAPDARSCFEVVPEKLVSVARDLRAECDLGHQLMATLADADRELEGTRRELARRPAGGAQ